MEELSIGIIGDFDEKKQSHRSTDEALKHAADRLGVGLTVTWLPTPSLVPLEARLKFDQYDAIWAAPGDHKAVKAPSSESSRPGCTACRSWGHEEASNILC